jgi:HlyD family secretion protein
MKSPPVCTQAIGGNRVEDISQAQANLNKAQVTQRQAAEDMHRNQELHAAGAISQQAFSTARTNNNSDQAQVNQTQQALKLPIREKPLPDR